MSIVANQVLTGVTNVLYGGSLTDMETCYKCMRTPIARSLHLESNRFDIEPEITAKLLRQGRRIVERPVRFDPRNRASGEDLPKLVLDVIRTAAKAVQETAAALR